mmetsp:Transcript_122888/g.216537  ORF Transcript_122888/g.216537 Transcript_122888/m.216537 type:complete len:222 (+) Transcript_122888:79-744(+)
MVSDVRSPPMRRVRSADVGVLARKSKHSSLFYTDPYRHVRDLAASQAERSIWLASGASDNKLSSDCPTAEPVRRLWPECFFNVFKLPAPSSDSPCREREQSISPRHEQEPIDSDDEKILPVRDVSLVESRYYQIELDNSEGHRLGLELDGSCGVALEIVCIMGGLVQEWNAVHQDSCIRVGDLIVAVNSIRDNSDGMLQEIRQKQAITLNLVSSLTPSRWL